MPLRPLLILMCVYLGLTLSGLHAMAALLKDFIVLWDLNNTEAGWLNSSQYFAYVAAVPLIALSERVDAKRMMLIGTAFNVAGYLGFALLADGLWSGVAFRILQGVGFALTYMPGAKAISDRVSSDQQGRAVSIYISSFATTTSFSLVIGGMIADAYSWREAFYLPALTNALAGLLILFALPPATPERSQGVRRALLDFRDEFRDPLLRGYFIAGTMHTVELLAVRGWTVVLLLYAGAGQEWLDQTTVYIIASALILIGMPTSMIGGEIGHRHGFAKSAMLAMLCSSIACAVVGFSVAGPFWLFAVLVLVHNLFVLADSGTLNGGATAAALPGRRGAAVTLMAFSNALGSLIGPVLFGFVLDLSGGREAPIAWGLAFLVISACMMVGVLVLRHGLRAGRGR